MAATQNKGVSFIHLYHPYTTAFT